MQRCSMECIKFSKGSPSEDDSQELCRLTYPTNNSEISSALIQLVDDSKQETMFHECTSDGLDAENIIPSFILNSSVTSSLHGSPNSLKHEFEQETEENIEKEDYGTLLDGRLWCKRKRIRKVKN